jgi:hypothetical protein
LSLMFLFCSASVLAPGSLIACSTVTGSSGVRQRQGSLTRKTHCAKG